jgi:hypothetical protein
MKLRLFLFLACTLLVGKATAQTGCTAHPLDFPPEGGKTIIYNTTSFCIASVDSSGIQTARLRWNNNNAGYFQLFDTDDSGALLWCAKDSSNHCAKGSSICLQTDGNLVIYDQENCQGSPLWATNTGHGGALFNLDCDGLARIIPPIPTCNEDGERLGVREVAKTGEESAYISNDTVSGSDTGVKFIWESNP